LVDGRTGYLKGDLIHFTHPNIKHIITKGNEYSTLKAEEKKMTKKVHWYNIIINPTVAFLKHFILRKGFMDGVYGFLISVIHSLTNLLTYIKIWEIQNIKTEK
jgi:hypothetical protein